MFKRFTGLAVALVAASTASAHPGHGAATSADAGTSMLHYVTEPVHFSAALLVLAVLVPIVAYGRGWWQRPQKAVD